MIYGLPDWLCWTVGAIAVGAGLTTIIAGDRVVHCLRRWLLRQLRWIRTPRYRKLLRWNGRLLFVLGLLLLLLMLMTINTKLRCG